MLTQLDVDKIKKEIDDNGFAYIYYIAHMVETREGIIDEKGDCGRLVQDDDVEYSDNTDFSKLEMVKSRFYKHKMKQNTYSNLYEIGKIFIYENNEHYEFFDIIDGENPTVKRAELLTQEPIRSIFEEEKNVTILPVYSENSIFARIFSIIFTIILAISITLALLLLVFSSQFAALLQDSPFHHLINVLTSPVISTLIFILLETLLFASLYKFLGFSNIKYKDHLPGSFVAAIIWIIFSKLYSIYINSFSNFSITYGSLAAVVLMMFWLK